MSKYEVGQRVKVSHPMGDWEGTVVMVRNTGEGVEYEVSGAPQKLGDMWFPLLWEQQVVGEVV